MSPNLIKVNGTYGAKIGNIQVFTMDGAINAYKTFLNVCHGDKLTLEGSVVLSEVEEDMIRIGFTAEELEKLEIEFLKNL